MYKKIDLTECSNYGVSEDAATEYIDYREQMGKRYKLTQRGFKRMLNEAVKCTTIGVEPDTAIEICIDKGWQGVTFEYVKAELTRRGQANETDQRINNKQRLVEATSGKTRSDWAH